MIDIKTSESDLLIEIIQQMAEALSQYETVLYEVYGDETHYDLEGFVQS